MISPTRPLPLLGGLTPQAFLKKHWHKKPLLIRQAIPELQRQAPISCEELFQLVADPDVESRIVSQARGKWKLEQGPFPELPPAARKAWTLLVQGVNLHDVRADEMMQRFRFLPDARLDDLMISWASDGGGVGPHFDSYDVFLLQVQGKRRWRISAQKDLSLVDGMPLKILRDFQPEQEWVLEPGDMLYLPPHYAHDGVAEGECMTWSVGFRAPAWQEMAEGFLQFMADEVELPGRYADPDLEAVKHPAELPSAMLDRTLAQLQKVRFERDDVALFLGEHLSSPKPQTFFVSPEKPLTAARFSAQAARQGVVLSPRTRMLYSGRRVFINGESFDMATADRKTLRTLADERRLSAEGWGQASADVKEALHVWYRDGWILPPH